MFDGCWFSDPDIGSDTLISSETMKPENKSTGLGPTFCRDGPSKHRRLRHRKEIAHQTQRPETGLTIFLRHGSSDMSNQKGRLHKIWQKSRQFDIADTSSGVLLPCCKLKKLVLSKGDKLRTFARNFSNIDFFLKILPLKDHELAMSEMKKKWGVTDFVLERTCPEEHLNLSKSCFVSEEDHGDCKSQNIAIRTLKGNVFCPIWFKWTY